jgi:hypothetical protein
MIKKHISRGTILFRIIPGFTALFLAALVGSILSSVIWMTMVIAAYFLFDSLFIMKNVYIYLSVHSLEEYESYFCDHYQRSFEKYRIRKRANYNFNVSKHLLMNKYTIANNGLFYKEYKYVAFDYIDPFLTFARQYSILVYTSTHVTNKINRCSPNEKILNYNVLVIDNINDSSEDTILSYKNEGILFDFVIKIAQNGNISIQRNFKLKEISGLDHIHNVKKQHDSFKSNQYLLISNFQRVCFIINKLF